MPELRGSAPAKINLVLEITGRRADGYHEIDTVLQTLELGDTVSIERTHGMSLDASGPFALGCPTDGSNLAWRAAEALAAIAPERAHAGLRIHLEKEVPPAGGLGGGASDAATVLRLLQQERSDLREADLLAAAAAVGSDEPFFVLGGTARARGRGELVEAIAPLPAHGVVLFIPPFTLERKTARMFDAIDRLPFDDGSVTEAFVRRRPAAITGADVYNGFERVAFDLFPGLAALWEGLEARSGAPIRLAGAGPTLFWIGPLTQRDQVAARCGGLACTIIPTQTAGSLWKP